MAPKTPSKTTQVTEVKLPEWVDNASQSNYQLAQQIAAKPYEAYTGQKVAGTSPMLDSAYGYLGSNIGVADKDYDAAGGAYGAASGAYGNASGIFNSIANTPIEAERIAAEMVKAGKLPELDRSKYMNPFIDQVENKAMGALDRNLQQQLMGNADKAAAANAFGGSRGAIVDAVTRGEANNNAGILSAGLRKEAFDTSSNLMMGDLDRILRGDISNADRKLSADSSNQSTNLQAQLGTQQGKIAAGQGMLGVGQGYTGVGQGYTGLGQARQSSMAQNFGLMNLAGQQQQQQSQKELSSAYEDWQSEQNHDIDSLNLQLSALGMSPYGKTENTEKTTTGGGSGTDFASMGMGLLSLLFGLSDERQKKDIVKVGEKTVPIYEYRYKGEPGDWPKIRGPMAQDVEKEFPEAVHDLGGVKVVHKRILEALSG